MTTVENTAHSAHCPYPLATPTLPSLGEQEPPALVEARERHRQACAQSDEALRCMRHAKSWQFMALAMNNWGHEAEAAAAYAKAEAEWFAAEKRVAYEAVALMHVWKGAASASQQPAGVLS